MLNKNERMNALNNAGHDTSKYFNVQLDNGTTIHLIIDENGDCRQVKDDPILEQIIEDGYVRNTKLHRRFVMAQMFQMLNYVSHDGRDRGYTACLNNRYSYNYTLEMMREEVRVLGKLETRDAESFYERVHFFDKNVVVAVMEDYLKKLKEYINTLPSHKCKGVPYKKIKGVNIFVADLDKKIYFPIRKHISNVRYARNYNEVYKALNGFMNKKTFIKLPYNTTKSAVWVDAYKGAGAYYTLKNLVMFHNCRIEVTGRYDLGVGNDAISYLKAALREYQGEYYRMFALMKKVIADNGINTRTYIAEVCDK